jgi:GTPase
MKPTLVLVGRPNVGKSTLFNRMTRSRAALVADIPGLTRDRHYGHGSEGDKSFLVVDTGGFEPVAKSGIYKEMARQTRQAVDEADVVLMMVDARQGVTPQDRQIADELRKTGRKLWLVANKAEGLAHHAVAEFHELGIGDPLPVSASHGEGMHDLLDLVLEDFPAEEPEDEQPDRPKIAVIGRPNVGKSTLVNNLLGEERMIAFDQPGTTRDSIYVDFERAGRTYTLIDTAGVRRRGKIEDVAEKFSVIKAMQAVEDANVVVLVLDVTQEISDQDAHLAGFALEAGRALAVAVNKWDAADDIAREKAKRDYGRKLNFRPGRNGRTCAAAFGRRRLRIGDGQTADAATDAGIACRRAKAIAAQGGRIPAEAAIRPSRRHEPAAHHDPRQWPQSHSGQLPALPGAHFHGGLRVARNAGKGILQAGPQSLCHSQEDLEKPVISRDGIAA